jgi:hypothetical protein
LRQPEFLVKLKKRTGRRFGLPQSRYRGRL